MRMTQNIKKKIQNLILMIVSIALLMKINKKEV